MEASHLGKFISKLKKVRYIIKIFNTIYFITIKIVIGKTKIENS